ncbi:atlastin [Thraustotheca clavata]|uniref:Atlastin n=1 Tax=Thraustotheca clavata TaxID=74557 RepID=A0A1V9ZS74_9STRA|nr:atlastin [Thraustotheca clavata]
MAPSRREWTPPPAVEAKQSTEPNWHMFAPLAYGPLIPLIRIGLRGRLPQKQIDVIFLSSVGIALSHAGYIMFSDSSVLILLQANKEAMTEQVKEVGPVGAIQIVRINDEGTKFELNEEAIETILGKVPADMKVSIISVVGAFRTGKSFVLDLFLRYLKYTSTNEAPDVNTREWAMAHGAQLEGNSNFEQTHGETGFSWRAGRKRNTTGIWMWGEPFLRKSKQGEDIAVFLIDTQGMFDSETSQMLTASIFGLSTLLSSYQIYNVDKRVQEDNLQHLALFTEYGRMALQGSLEQTDNQDIKSVTLRSMKSIGEPTSETSLTKQKSSQSQESELVDGTDVESDDDGEGAHDGLMRPFQHLDFLVRDWQDFKRKATLAEKKADMKAYTQEILSTRKQQDLADTREQIFACFETISCVLLSHPGHAVTDRDYDGSIEEIDERFMELLTSYLNHLFSRSTLEPKRIHGVAVNSRELLTFIKSYASLFKEATIFPEAKTLLEATAEANNVNMKEKALAKYKFEMAKVVGPKCNYVKPMYLTEHHRLCTIGAMTVFDNGAKMGRQSAILKFRGQLAEEIEKEHVRYVEVNAERDPYKNLEFYIVPMTMVVVLFVFRVTQDLFCYESVGYDIPIYDCKHVSVTLTHLYWAVITFMLIVTFATGSVMYERIKAVFAIAKTAFMEQGTKQKSD